MATIDEKIAKLQALADDPAAFPGEREQARQLIKKLQAKKFENAGSKKQNFNQAHARQASYQADAKTGKVKVDFGNPSATIRQKEYITNICRYFDLNVPNVWNMSYEEASKFLNEWAPRFQKAMNEAAAMRQYYRNQYSNKK